MTDDERVIQDLVANTSRKFYKHFWTHFQKIVSFFSVCQQTFRALDIIAGSETARVMGTSLTPAIARKNINKNFRPSLVRAV